MSFASGGEATGKGQSPIVTAVPPTDQVASARTEKEPIDEREKVAAGKRKVPRRAVAVLLNLLTGLIIGLFAGSVAVVTHASPLNCPWIGLILAAVLILVGGWFAAEAAEIPGALGYVAGVVATTLIFMFSPLGGDITALETSLVSRIWVFAGPILAFISLGSAIRRNSR